MRRVGDPQDRRWVPGVVLVGVLLVLLGSCKSLKCMKERYTGIEERTSYYAPTLSPDGEAIAYLRREMRYSIAGGGMFGTGAITFFRDDLFLCTSLRSRSNERCMEEWGLPINKSHIGRVEAQLAWEGDKVRYLMTLGSFENATLGVEAPNRGRGPERILANVPLDQPFPASPPPRGWRVRLDKNPLQYAYPIDNEIIVERTGGGE
jgi:hypothetical protein